jgi:hypothetical protein
MKFNEQQIKEKRTVEAIQKEYMGFQGKLVCIAKNLGNEILDQGGVSETLSYDDFWKTSDDEIQEMDMESNVDCIGWFFDGLGMGVNLEIFVFENDKKIKVEYDSQNVYEEVSGELESYVPNIAWEEKINPLYKRAKEKESANREKQKEASKSNFEENKKKLINYLSNKWGI